MSENHDRLLNEARSLIKSKLYVEAENVLDRIVSDTPDSVIGWQELGNVRYRSGQYDKAVEAFQRQYGLAPDNPTANYSLGVSFTKLGRVDEARIFLTRATEIKPDFDKAKKRLAQLDATRSTSKPHDISSDSVQSDSSSFEESKLSESLKSGVITPGKVMFSGRSGFKKYGKRLRRLGFLIIGSTVLLVIILLWFLNMYDNSSRSNDDTVIIFFVIILIVGLVGILFGFVYLLSYFLVLSSWRIDFVIYERRIDYEVSRLFSQAHDSIWLYEIKDVTMAYPRFSFFGMGNILINSERGQLNLWSFAPTNEIKEVWEYLRETSLVQRREMKGVFV